jgi:hypothetical protein
LTSAAPVFMPIKAWLSLPPTMAKTSPRQYA